MLAPLLLLLASSSVAHAGAPGVHLDPYGTDLPRVRSLLPAGREIARAYASSYDAARGGQVVTLLTGSDYANAVADSYVFADLDGNGTTDLAVATELPPSAPAGPDGGNTEFGARLLLIYLADSAGTLQPTLEAAHVLLSGADGGVFGEPFAGLHVTGARTLDVEHYGGSSQRWSITQKFQYRSGEFYLVGETRGTMNLGDGSTSAVDTNLLTGDQVLTSTSGQDSGDAPGDVTKKKLGKQPLVKLVDAKVIES